MDMEKKLIFVTGNEGKLREVRAFLAASDNSLQIEAEKIDLPELQGPSGEFISRQKAEEAFRKVNAAALAAKSTSSLVPVLVEDTSLIFHALGGKLPGPYIKWFLEDLGCEGLTKMVAGFKQPGEEDPLQHRRATARCIFSLCECIDTAMGALRVTQFIGECSGHLAEGPRGGNNFGWDSIFVPDEDQACRKPGKRTFAEMSMEEKSLVSHRINGLKKLKDYFASLKRPRES